MVCRRIREKVNKMYVNDVGTISVSIGLANFEKEDTFDSILLRADQALYEAKEKGRDQVVLKLP